MFGLEDCSVSQVQSIRVAHPAESRFYEVGVHARFIEQNDRPYSNGMGREAHVLVSRKIRMARLLITVWRRYCFRGQIHSIPEYYCLRM